MAEMNRKFKDSVFAYLFSDPKYLRELYLYTLRLQAPELLPDEADRPRGVDRRMVVHGLELNPGPFREGDAHAAVLAAAGRHHQRLVIVLLGHMGSGLQSGDCCPLQVHHL